MNEKGISDGIVMLIWFILTLAVGVLFIFHIMTNPGEEIKESCNYDGFCDSNEDMFSCIEDCAINFNLEGDLTYWDMADSYSDNINTFFKCYNNHFGGSILGYYDKSVVEFCGNLTWYFNKMNRNYLLYYRSKYGCLNDTLSESICIRCLCCGVTDDDIDNCIEMPLSEEGINLCGEMEYRISCREKK